MYNQYEQTYMDSFNLPTNTHTHTYVLNIKDATSNNVQIPQTLKKYIYNNVKNTTRNI